MAFVKFVCTLHAPTSVLTRCQAELFALFRPSGICRQRSFDLRDVFIIIYYKLEERVQHVDLTLVQTYPTVVSFHLKVIIFNTSLTKATKLLGGARTAARLQYFPSS